MTNNREPFLDPMESTRDLLGDWNLSTTIERPESLQSATPVAKPSGGPHNNADRSLLTGRISSENRAKPRLERIVQSDSDLIGAFDLTPRLSKSDNTDDLDNESGESKNRPGKVGSTILKPDAEAHFDQCKSKPKFPGLGESLSGFRIIKELGRGAFARVYLAEESTLGNRLVAIKVSEATGDEPQVLAKLQHTHIVPVHSVHTDVATGLRILCMPYFGGANLAEVLESEVFSSTSSKRSGGSLIQALDRISGYAPFSSTSEVERTNLMSKSEAISSQAVDRNPIASLIASRNASLRVARRPMNPYSWIVGRRSDKRLPKIRRDLPFDSGYSLARGRNAEVDQPSRRFLRGASGIQAAVWVVARLAEGLGHAHARGLLHRDIKPSNVLIAADGTPMLLDFNLSVERESAKSEKDLSHAMIGGTLPYMSPEHLDAFNPQGKTAPTDVDARSDIYALGLILFEMIAGHHPFPEPDQQKPLLATIKEMLSSRMTVPSLRATRPDVPWSIDALVAKCLNPDPRRRYEFAEDLAEDLRRFLDNLPMKYCPEPSPLERLEKWARRNPALSSSTSVGIFGLALVLLLGASVSLLYNKIQDVSSRLRLQVFRQGFTDAQFWLNTQSDKVEHLEKGLALSLQALQDLGLFNSSGVGGAGWISKLPKDEREQTWDQGVELGLLHARAIVKLAEKLGNERDRRIALERALQILDHVLTVSPRPMSAIFLERAKYEDALGQADRAESDRRKAAEIPTSTSYDNLVLGASLLADGKLLEAEIPLKAAIRQDVTSFWAWFSLGHCYFQQGRFADAVAAFTGCVVRGPKFAWAHFNLGLALAKSGRLLDAKSSYARAVELEPRFPEALINKGLVELELNQLEEALDDLKRGIADGQDDPGVLAAYGEALARLGRQEEAERFFTKALERNPDSPNVLVARGMTRLRSNPDGASSDFRSALKIDSDHPTAHYGMARRLRIDDPAGALGHLNEALKVKPNFMDALQLRALIRARIGEPSTLGDVERLLELPTPHGLYNAACALAIYAESTNENRWLRRSYELLTRAIAMGFPKGEAESDPDLKILWRQPEFKGLLTNSHR